MTCGIGNQGPDLDRHKNVVGCNQFIFKMAVQSFDLWIVKHFSETNYDDWICLLERQLTISNINNMMAKKLTWLLTVTRRALINYFLAKWAQNILINYFLAKWAQNILINYFLAKRAQNILNNYFSARWAQTYSLITFWPCELSIYSLITFWPGELKTYSLIMFCHVSSKQTH
jgi:hypothetical protein